LSGRSLALCYHAVSGNWPAPLAVQPDQLERQVRTALERGYRPTTFHELVLGAPAGKRVAVTFDDAYLSVYELAFPLLSRLGVPATVFVPTGHVGANHPMSWPGIDHWLDGEWRSELRGASWDQLRELAEADWEIGSHTRSHPRLPEVEASQLAAELEGSRLDCEREIGRPCRTIAYPYGAFDDRVVAATADAGYEAGAGLASRAPVGDRERNPMRLPRVAVYRGDRPSRIRTKAWLLDRHPRVWNLLIAARAARS
jgi:peptidoglycan/xylan/chitin deacetylase (PgdA/CDA1 family)